MGPNKQVRHLGKPAMLAAIFWTMALGGTTHAHAASSDCRLSYKADDETTEIIAENGFEFEGFGELCLALKAQGLAVLIDSDYGVLAGRSYGAVVIAVLDKQHSVRSRNTVSAISMSEDASTPGARRQLMDAINTGLRRASLTREKLIQSWQENIARLRAELGAKG